MRPHRLTLIIAPMLCLVPLARGAERAGPRLTIYNQDFALVRETRSLTFEEGVGEARVTGVTALLEPDSVILRDPGGADRLRVLEQNYVADPLSQGFLLRRHEGKTLLFQRLNPATGALETVRGRVIRSGYEPGGGGPWPGRGAALPLGAGAPIVEVDGLIRFSLPGEPLFEPPGKDAILSPTLLWTLQSDRSGARDVELSYLTGGLRWEATYNLVAPESGDRFDLVGWVTLENMSGAEFRDARVKLMAGDVSRAPGAPPQPMMMALERADAAAGPPVTGRPFDEYHLYTVDRPTTLKDREIKQVEFCRGAGVPGERFYVYDGAAALAHGGWDVEAMRTSPAYGAQGNTKVAAMLEFRNTAAAGLGIPLPRGTMKLYRTDLDGGREFIGENRIDHTPADETVRLELGHAFDLVGERRPTSFRVDRSRETADESFEIRLRNRTAVAAEIRVVERLYRWTTWRIENASHPYAGTDARTVEFRVAVPAGGEAVVTYDVHYSW